MADEKDRFGDTMKLMERAQEDIYFAEHDRELLNKLKEQLKKVDQKGSAGPCPKCAGSLETWSFKGIILDKCSGCGGVWMDKGELEAVIHKVTRGPLGAWLDKLTAKEGE